MSLIQIRAFFPDITGLTGTKPRFDAIHILRKEFTTDVMADLHATTATWTHKPHMTVRNSFHEVVRKYEMGIKVTVDDAIWNKLNDGFVRTIKVHRYTNKTIPGFLGSIPGGGNVLRTAQIPPLDVEPRAWMDALYDKYIDRIERRAPEILAEVMHAEGLDKWAI